MSRFRFGLGPTITCQTIVADTSTHAPQKPLRMTEFSDWKLGQPMDMTPPNTQDAEKIDLLAQTPPQRSNDRTDWGQ